MMNEDNYDEFKEKAKELFKTNMNTLPYHVLDLSFKTTMSEIIYNMFTIKLTKGNLKITNFKNSYGIEDETNDIMDVITSMKFEILDNNNISIVNGAITCIYDENEKDGELLVSIDESISNKYMVDIALNETYFKSDNIIEKYNIIDRVSSINKNGIELIHTINEIIGDIFDYTDTRFVFVIDNKE